MEWMFLPLKRYAEFSGRSRRKEYWMFALLNVLVFMVLGLTVAASLAMSGMGDMASGEGGLGAASGGIGSMVVIAACIAWALAIFVPSIAVQVRRFHDQNKSGWWVLIGFVPFIGGLILFVFMLMEGTSGPNEYRPDPKAAPLPS